MIAAVVGLLLGSSARAGELPPIPAELLGSAAVVCARVDEKGAVEAFIVTTTGDATKDKAVLAWVRQLRWDPAPGDASRNHWFPMPVAIGRAVPPPPPESCAPQDR